MKNKYGFVYIWKDRKRKMFYIGSHWGTIDDGYICSSNRMRNAYRRRPDDFKRRILKIVTSSRRELLEEEFRWLEIIPKHELGKKYYNLRTHYFGHWSSDPNLYNQTIEKLSKPKSSLKGKPLSEEHKQAISKGNKGKPKSEEHRRKISEVQIGKISPFRGKKRNYSEETKIKMGHMKGKKCSNEVKEKRSKALKGHKKSEEWKSKISDSIKKTYENPSLADRKSVV